MSWDGAEIDIVNTKDITEKIMQKAMENNGREMSY